MAAAMSVEPMPSAGVAVRAYNERTGADEPLFGQKGVFDAASSDIVELLDAVLAGEIAHDAALLGGFYVFRGHEMVEHEHNFFGADDAAARLFQPRDRDGRSDIVAEDDIHARGDEFAREDALSLRMTREYLLSSSLFHSRLTPPGIDR